MSCVFSGLKRPAFEDIKVYLKHNVYLRQQLLVTGTGTGQHDLGNQSQARDMAHDLQCTIKTEMVSNLHLNAVQVRIRERTHRGFALTSKQLGSWMPFAPSFHDSRYARPCHFCIIIVVLNLVQRSR